MPEDYIAVLLPLVWGAFLGLPLVGITLAARRHSLFEKISKLYFKFTFLFTLGSFIFLIEGTQWKGALDYLLSGQMWILHVTLPAAVWVFAAYYIYRIWKDLINGLREEHT